MRDRLRFLSLCAGAGGLDVGLEMAGWQPLAQIEINPDCCHTLKASRTTKPEVRVINAGLETIDPRELRLALGLKRGELDLIAGGPPCQPFTTHGLRKTLMMCARVLFFRAISSSFASSNQKPS